MSTNTNCIQLARQVVQGMHKFFRNNSINEELIFIAVLVVILTIVLLCEYRQKRLEKKSHTHSDE